MRTPKPNTRICQSNNDLFLSTLEEALNSGAISELEYSEFSAKYQAETNDWQVTCLAQELMLKINAYSRPKDTHAPFKFSLLGEDFDVRPLFSCFEMAGVEHIAKVIDSVLFSYIENMPEDLFCRDVKDNIYYLKELRNAITNGANKNLEIDERNHQIFSYKYLESRVNTEGALMQKTA